MASEGTETLILAFTSKTGQSVAHTRHRIFKYRFFCQVKDTLRHFIDLIHNPDFKGTRNIMK